MVKLYQRTRKELSWVPVTCGGRIVHPSRASDSRDHVLTSQSAAASLQSPVRGGLSSICHLVVGQNKRCDILRREAW